MRPPGRCPYRSKQFLHHILSHCGHRLFSHLRQRYHVIWDKSWNFRVLFFCLELVFHWRRVTNMVTLECGPLQDRSQIIAQSTQLLLFRLDISFLPVSLDVTQLCGKLSFLHFKQLHFPPSDFSALLDVTSWEFHVRWNSKDSQDFQETQPGFLSPWLEGQINKAAAAMATLMSPSLMAWHDSLVVLRCHRHVSEDPCRCYSCVKWTSRKQQHFINYLH